MVEALRRALLQVREVKALRAPKSGHFIEGADADYDLIREEIEKNHQFFK